MQKHKKKATEGIKHEGVILLANVLRTAFSFLSLIFLWSFLKCTASRKDHQAPSLVVTIHPPSAYLLPTHGSAPRQ